MADTNASLAGLLPPPVQSGRRQTGMTLFPVTVFMSAALVFLVEPMVGKLLLPLLGGAPAVWNTSLAFFQLALLLGYGYAHLLQRVTSFRAQVLIHGVVLAAAALCLPLHVSGLLGRADSTHPVLWLVGTLSLSIGAPFAALSATAPLTQAWFARTAPLDPLTGKTREPYALYAASNLGSLLALIAYPLIVEPLLHLSTQRMTWSLGYAVLAMLMIGLGLVHKARPAPVTATSTPSARPTTARLLTWVALAALPSSLMMGVTSYLSTDVATAPFLWVVPLALYLLTFVIVFAAKPVISSATAQFGQAIAVCACIWFLPFMGSQISLQLLTHLTCFFMTALVCHLALAKARPEPGQLTLYYLCMSLGGVVGGSFNAFVTPVIFPTVIEYPLVLVLACLARPWNGFKLSRREIIPLGIGLAAGGGALGVILLSGDSLSNLLAIKICFFLALVCAFLLRGRALAMTAVLAVVAIAGQSVGQTGKVVAIDRSFFGVSKVIEIHDPMVGPVREMVHGTTLHGAQELTPGRECTPLTYYTAQTPIGQTLNTLQARSPALDMAVVGLGAGTVSTYVRPTDHLTFFEIDPVVVKLARDPRYFTYLSKCAKAPVNIETGDARLTLSPLAPAKLDLLMVDAFSSDAVPAHLLTVEAVRMYLSKVKPDGVVLFHLSNRHLELRDPVIAAIRQAGGVSLEQTHMIVAKSAVPATSSMVVIAAKSPAALAAFHAQAGWKPRDPGHVAAWTDDYMNLIGAMLRYKQP